MSPDIIRLCRICKQILKITIIKYKIKSKLNHYTNNLPSACSNINLSTELTHLSAQGESNHKHWLVESIEKIYFSIRIKKNIWKGQKPEYSRKRVRHRFKG